MLGLVNPWYGKPPTGEPYAGEPPVRFGGRGDRETDLPYPYLPSARIVGKPGKVNDDALENAA
jgi:hypothetical protein